MVGAAAAGWTVGVAAPAGVALAVLATVGGAGALVDGVAAEGADVGAAGVDWTHAVSKAARPAVPNDRSTRRRERVNGGATKLLLGLRDPSRCAQSSEVTRRVSRMACPVANSTLLTGAQDDD